MDSQTPQTRQHKIWGWIAIVMLSITMLSSVMQLTYVASALLGGRENRIHLMGAFALAPVSLLLGLITLFAVAMASMNKKRPIVAVLACLLVGQLCLFLFG